MKKRRYRHVSAPFDTWFNVYSKSTDRVIGYVVAPAFDSALARAQREFGSNIFVEHDFRDPEGRKLPIGTPWEKSKYRSPIGRSANPLAVSFHANEASDWIPAAIIPAAAAVPVVITSVASTDQNTRRVGAAIAAIVTVGGVVWAAEKHNTAGWLGALAASAIAIYAGVSAKPGTSLVA